MPDHRRYVDRAEYLKQAVAQRRKKVKALVVGYKGGRCQICGYDRSIEALELHHRLAKTKNFAVSGQGLTRSWLRVKREADKCVLLCANCHREVHAGRQRLPRSRLTRRGKPVH